MLGRPWRSPSCLMNSSISSADGRYGGAQIQISLVGIIFEDYYSNGRK